MARKPANKNENEAAQAVEEVVQTAEEKAEETVKAAADTAEEVEQTTEEKAEELKKAVEETAAKVMKKAEKTAAEVKKTAKKATEEVKKAAPEAAKKVVEKAKKAAAKKDIKTEVVLQYGEKEVNTKDMIAAVKKEWTKARHKVSDIKSIELYLKPEDYAVYYVINGDTTGKIWM